MTLLKQITAQHGGAAGYLVKKSHELGAPPMLSSAELDKSRP